MDSDFMNNLANMMKNGNVPNDVKNFINNMKNNNDSSTSNNSANNLNNINPEMLKNIMNMFNNSNTSTDSNSSNGFNNFNSSNNSTFNNSSDEDNSNTSGMPNFDINMLLKMKSIMDKMNSNKNDPRSNLLLSLKPYLKESRKSKVEQYIQLFNMSKVFNVFNQNGGENSK